MAIAPPTVTADSVYVKNLDDGTVYYTKGLDAPAGGDDPVSLTKLMTAKVVRNNKTLVELQSETTTITANDVSVEGSGNFLQVGDVISLYELMAGMLIGSSNQSAMALARVIGAESLGGTPTDTASVAEFVSMMNTEGTSLGLTDSTFANPDGLNASPKTVMSVDDVAVVFEAVLADSVITDLFFWESWDVHLTRGGSLNDETASTSAIAGSNNFLATKLGTRGTDDVFNIAVWYEAPNGQRLIICIMGSSSNANRQADLEAIINELLTVDETQLATPGTPWTPSYMFTDLSAGGDWWDPSDSGNIFQDYNSGSPITAAVDGDPVGAWVGKVNGNVFRQTSATARPIRRDDSGVWNFQYDGSNDFLTLGASSVGATNLFAGTGDPFMVGTKSRTEAANGSGTTIAKGSADTADRNFHIYVQNATTSEPAITFRGEFTPTDEGLNDGSYHAFSGFWDESKSGFGRDELGTRHVTVGAAANEAAQEICLGARTNGTGFLLTGRIGDVVIVDTFDADHWKRMQWWLNGASVNAFADPTGGGHTASGSLQAGSAAISGAALRTILASGTLGAGASAVSGSASAAAAVYQPQGVNFDGTNDWLTRGADLTGVADGQSVTGSFWFKTGDISTVVFIGNTGNRFAVLKLSTGEVRVLGISALSSIVLDLRTTGNYEDGIWHHCCFSSNGTTAHLYVDDASDKNEVTLSATDIDFTRTDWGVGALPDGSLKGEMDGADLWLDPGTYIDLSVTANRRKFVGSGAATSVDLGADGSTPTGTAPLVFLSGATADWHTNKGAGGGFTENGALTDAATDPPASEAVAPSASGSIESGSAAISGEAMRAIMAAGAVQAQLAAIVAEASRTAKAQGSPQAQASTTEGAATGGKQTASGTLQTGASSTEGVAGRTIKAAGTLASGAAPILGAATIIVQGVATGALQAGAAAIEGAASRTAKAAGALASGAAAVSGAAERINKAAGAIASGAASIAGAAVRAAKASGTLASGAAAIVGRMVINIVRPSFGLTARMSDAPVAVSATMSDEVALSSSMSDEPVALSTTIAP